MAVKSSGDISAEPVRGQKIEEHVGIDLDVHNDEIRPSLTSGALAEERQDVLSKNAIDELADTITGGKEIGLWLSNIPENIREYLLKNEKLILKHDVPQHRKDRNPSRKWPTNLIRRQNNNAEVVEMKTLWKLALFFSFTNLCLLFHL